MSNETHDDFYSLLEERIRNLPWTEKADEHMKTVVAGNWRTAALWGARWALDRAEKVADKSETGLGDPGGEIRQIARDLG